MCLALTRYMVNYFVIIFNNTTAKSGSDSKSPNRLRSDRLRIVIYDQIFRIRSNPNDFDQPRSNTIIHFDPILSTSFQNDPILETSIQFDQHRTNIIQSDPIRSIMVRTDDIPFIEILNAEK